MSGAFTQYDLRTTDPEAAAAFYAEVVGLQQRSAGDARELYWREQRVGALTLLPERARAQGAPAHWLGHIGVADVEAAVRDVLGLGGQQLGPTQRTSDGRVLAALKDAQGVPFALSTPRPEPRAEVVVWHELYATDWEAEWAGYSGLFGWQKAEALELGPPVGTYQLFILPGAPQPLGAMSNSARIPGVHPQWLYYFTVPNLDVALAKVRQLGGLVANGPMEVPGGARVAQCEDPQGGAFALHHHPRGG
ncbi:VOC family protein [Aggregicoccus sp. 17bor-14]|uniref:VOC family protein n=1 Tax=Myxococcaceae TaxID=31 RepID=UPI00129C1595|nr:MULTISPECIES: VOC family protein [Myxococcaceae]MBF5046216.1 VOC family protein [Simulacricoccus sp. 17bor-14]MRI91940.1 VOC family protein [Aggregicoccus sp. 17bor-14]